MNLKVNSTTQTVKWVAVLFFFIKVHPEGEPEASISGVTKGSK